MEACRGMPSVRDGKSNSTVTGGRTLITTTPVDRSRARNTRVEFAMVTARALFSGLVKD
jgi:hypothetical protein